MLSYLSVAAILVAIGQADDAWAQYNDIYVGTFAVNGACTDVDAQWRLEPRTISGGGMQCVIHDVEPAPIGLTLRVRDCASGQTTLPTASFQLDFRSTDLLRISGPSDSVLVEECLGF